MFTLLWFYSKSLSFERVFVVTTKTNKLLHMTPKLYRVRQKKEVNNKIINKK